MHSVSDQSSDRKSRDGSFPASLSRLQPLPEFPVDAVTGTEHDFTASPEGSPNAGPSTSSSRSQTQELPLRSSAPYNGISDGIGQTTNGSRSQTQNVPLGFSPLKIRARTAVIPSSTENAGDTLSQTDPNTRPSTPSSFSTSRPSTPNAVPSSKPKPKPSRLNTINLEAPTSSSPPRSISPSLKHWQQVRAHVLAPSPADEKISQNLGRAGVKKLGIVSKAAGRLGLRHAAENVMGYEERRDSMMGLTGDLGGLSLEEKEEIARERRKFARDVKTCLDACALEESRRRIRRTGHAQARAMPEPKTSASSVHGSNQTAQRFNFDPDFSAFAPLLTELHRYLPAARAKRPWSRTCPHHAAILAELGVTFLPDNASTDGERQQALEVFGVVVRNWASDNAEEELDRWLWLCRTLLTDDRQLRNRGFPLLRSFFHADPNLPSGPDRPHSAEAFQSIAAALLALLHVIEVATSASDNHHRIVTEFIADLSAGDIFEVERATLADQLSATDLSGSQLGVEAELVWMTVGKLMPGRPGLASWLLASGGETLNVSRLASLSNANEASTAIRPSADTSRHAASHSPPPCSIFRLLFCLIHIPGSIQRRSCLRQASLGSCVELTERGASSARRGRRTGVPRRRIPPRNGHLCFSP